MMHPSERCETCKHYTGGKVFGEIYTLDEFREGVFLPTCKAFPKGIPIEITNGQNKHDTPIDGQDNDIVYEKAGGNNAN